MNTFLFQFIIDHASYSVAIAGRGMIIKLQYLKKLGWHFHHQM